ncbi:MAG: hypothetical protein KBB54_01615, partial [Candidatus Pacebacteria bacterium]|nr:hypothetical protein [Candidatus Paceibacterota bacterium]
MNSDTKIISIIGIITVIVIILGVMFASSPAGQTGDTNLPPITVRSEALVRPDSLRVTGSNPKIQFVEFADFECPACAMLHPSLKKI